jgi:glycosyltransferase involved in cell wall biosynthesis
MKKLDSSINILHVTFNMGIGGTEQVIYQLINSLLPHNVNSEVICIDGTIGAIGKRLQKKGVSVTKLSRSGGVDLHLIKNIKTFLISKNFDIIHCHQYTPYFYGLLASFGLPARVVFTEHGRFYPDKFRYKAIFINPILALMTSSIIAISSATRLALAKYEFIPKYKIQVIYNGIEGLVIDESEVLKLRGSLNLTSETYIVGTISRLDSVKNHPMLLKAFRLFIHTHPESRLLIVGDGPERGNLHELVKDLGISDKVIFTGFINDPKSYLALIDLFTLTSFTEGTSMTLLEAMSIGKPIIATRVGGNPEVIENSVTGILVDSDNELSLAEAMFKIRNDSDLSNYFSSNGKKLFARKFSSRSMALEYMNVYKKR